MATSTYELLEMIGRGGMGTVYRAQHRLTGSPVAVKVMSDEAAARPELRLRFGQEFLAASRVRHPNVVRALACGLEGDRPYLVMELVDGRSLGHRIARHGPLPEGEAARIGVQIADGLAAAHDLGLVHRDVKPDNILLAADGVAKLTDLGLVKDRSIASNLTGTRTGLGTAAYVAPEQADDARSADARADVYGLGATLYHALTGVAPFEGKMLAVILKKQILNQFIPPRRLLPGLNPALDEAICRAMDSTPSNRQQSCGELAAALRFCLGEAPLPPARGRSGDERRRSPRFACNAAVACGDAQDRAGQLVGTIVDASQSGLLLLLPHRFEPGSILMGEAFDGGRSAILQFRAEVRWVRKAHRGRWALGCSFDQELDPEILFALLGNPNPTTVALAPRG